MLSNLSEASELTAANLGSKSNTDSNTAAATSVVTLVKH